MRGEFISMSDIYSYEKAAMLELPESERMTLMDRFDKVAGGFSALDAYDTCKAEPLVSVLDIQNVIREDIPAKIVTREELLSNAPEQYDGYIRVPATID